MTSKKSLHENVKRPNFREKVTIYGIEGGSIMPCAKHPDQLIKSPTGPAGGITRIDYAWQKGWISSDAQAAKDLFGAVYNEIPNSCPKCDASGL